MATRAIEDVRECDERLTQVFGLLGKRWSGVILGTLLAGPAHFTAIARAIPGISERMLSDRLTEMARAGILEREVISGPPLGVVYRLTRKGKALEPGLLKLSEWAERYGTPTSRSAPRHAGRRPSSPHRAG